MESIGMVTIRWVKRMHDESLMTKSISMVTIRWVKRMRDGSLITELIGMDTIRWVKRMCDILQHILDDKVDRHGHDPIGQEDA